MSTAHRGGVMRTFVSAVLGVIALGILLIAYGVINPRAATIDQLQSRGGTVGDRLSLRDDFSVASTPQLELRCEVGQRAVVRQVGGAAAARCVDDDAWAGDRPRASSRQIAYTTADERIVYARPAASQAPRRTVVRRA